MKLYRYFKSEKGIVEDCIEAKEFRRVYVSGSLQIPKAEIGKLNRYHDSAYFTKPSKAEFIELLKSRNVSIRMELEDRIRAYEDEYRKLEEL